MAAETTEDLTLHDTATATPDLQMDEVHVDDVPVVLGDMDVRDDDEPQSPVIPAGPSEPETLAAVELPVATPTPAVDVESVESAADMRVDSEEPLEESPSEAIAATPGFVKQADRKAFWRRPRVRGLLVLLLLLLVVALALQAGVQERDRIAAQWPQARPLLVSLCEVAGCEVGALRRIESITIDGSSFTRLRPDAYRLSINLKNNADVDLAMPSVELTLTDTQDQSVVRRVLSPAEMGAAATLAAGTEWNGAVPIAVTPDGGGASRVAGYRVLAFYP
jgi:hypothetical protein